MKTDYEALYNEATVDFTKLEEITARAYMIRLNKSRYQEVEAATQVPWYIVAAIHSLESDCDFTTNLANGDPLTARTVHVPQGRPTTGTPPFTWEFAAGDALLNSGLWFPGVTGSNWTLAEALEFMERYNGLGYFDRGINTPYLWSFTNLYTKGLFVSDDNFDANAVSDSIGAAALLKIMALKGYINL